MRQLIIEYPHPRYPHYPQQKPAPSLVGLGRGQQAKGLFAGIRKCSIFNCRINNHVLSPLHFLQQKSAAETAYLLNIKNALLIYKTRFKP